MSRFLAPYQTFFSKLTDAPPEFGHATALTILGTAACGRRWINRGRGGIHPNLYTMLVAGSSKDRKSTSVEAAVDLLRMIEPERIAPSDYTAEGLLRWMAPRKGKEGQQDFDGRPVVLIPMPEFGQQLATSTGYGLTIGPTLCTLYDGSTYERVRAGSAPITIERPRVSTMGAVAYGMLERYGDPRDWGTGFYSRFLFVTSILGNRIKYDAEPEFPDRESDIARAALSDLVRHLEANVQPMAVSKEALDLYRANVPTLLIVSTRTVGGTTEGDQAQIAQRERLLHTIWKLALLYQIDEDPAQPIGPSAMDLAFNFARLCWASFLKIYAHAATDRFGRLLRRIFNYVAEGGPEGIAQSVVLRNFAVDAAGLHAVVDLLVKWNMVVIRDVATGSGLSKSAVKRYLIAPDPMLME